jgi:hypothetical protein
MANQIVVLTSSPNQKFTIQLQVDGAALTLVLAFSWSEMAGYWIMAIFDSTGRLLADSIPVITGSYPAANLLAQQQYLKIGSAYILNNGNVNADYPGVNNLGSDFKLLWGDSNTVAA